MARLESAGIPVAAARARDQLKVLASEQTYLEGGCFVVERMYGMLEEAVAEAENSDFKRVRTLGDMEWARKNCDGTEELIVYEARVNELAPLHDCTLLCAYDITRFSGRVIADVLATHFARPVERASAREPDVHRASGLPEEAGPPPAERIHRPARSRLPGAVSSPCRRNWTFEPLHQLSPAPSAASGEAPVGSRATNF